MNTKPEPILTAEQIEELVMKQFPVTPGEKRCRNERRTMRELREWKRKQYQQQNEANAAYNQYMEASAARLQQQFSLQPGLESSPVPGDAGG